MSAYLYGILTVPALAIGLWLIGGFLVRAWDAWEKLLRRLRPWKAREHGRAAAIIATSPTVWVVGLPGMALVIAHVGNNPLRAARLNTLGWKIDRLARETVEQSDEP